MNSSGLQFGNHCLLRPCDPILVPADFPLHLAAHSCTEKPDIAWWKNDPKQCCHHERSREIRWLRANRTGAPLFAELNRLDTCRNKVTWTGGRLASIWKIITIMDTIDRKIPAVLQDDASLSIPMRNKKKPRWYEDRGFKSSEGYGRVL